MILQTFKQFYQSFLVRFVLQISLLCLFFIKMFNGYFLELFQIIIMTETSGDKKPFYLKARKEYENAQKPFIYQFNIKSTEPKIKKFSIVINKFLQIFKEGMKQEYLARFNQNSDCCWQFFSNKYGETYEMDFMKKNIYDKQKFQLLQYFGILIHTKSIFTFLQQAVNDYSEAYKNPILKKINLKEQLKVIDFLKDGKYKIQGEIITKYDQYAEERKQKQLLQEKQRKIKQQKKRKEQQVKKQKEEIQKKLQKQENQRKRLQEEIKNKKLQQMKKQEETIQKPDYAPQNWQGRKTNLENKYDNFQEQKEIQKPIRNQKKSLKNSEVLFNQRYKPQLEAFAFRMKPQSISTNKQKCFQCGQPLSAGLYLFGGNLNLCYYTGQWFCNNDINEERISIPWYGVQNFDLRGYQVSKKAYMQIKSLYDKPILQIVNESDVVKNNAKLREFLVVRRQIHLMYDAICNLELIDMLLKKKLNYCVKKNLFSLKNLYDIYNGQEINNLNQHYELLSKHFYRCDTCQRKRGYNCPKCKDPVKIFPFEVREVVGCKICKKIYHRACNPGPCDCATREQ